MPYCLEVKKLNLETARMYYALLKVQTWSDGVRWLDSFNNYFLRVSYRSALVLGASNMEGYEPHPPKLEATI